MDFDEFEIDESSINTEKEYSEEIEYMVKQLNSIAHAAGRYSRSVQLPMAIRIIRELKEMNQKKLIINKNK